MKLKFFTGCNNKVIMPSVIVVTAVHAFLVIAVVHVAVYSAVTATVAAAKAVDVVC